MSAAVGLLVCLPLAAEDGCISDPAEGIFCAGDENTSYETYTIYGNESATWTATTLTDGVTYYYNIQPGASLRVTGDAAGYYRAKTIVSGSGDFHLIAGYLRIHSLGALFGHDLHVEHSHLAGLLYGNVGGNWFSGATLHLTDGTLRLERDWDYANTVANPFVLSGQARIEVVSPVTSDPGNVAVSATGAISGNGTLVKAGPGLLGLQAANTYSGGTEIRGGNLEITTDANLGAADAPVTFGADAGLWLNDGFASSARPTALESGLGYLGVRSGSATWNGVISGAGGLVKSGPGTLTLTADNTYADGTSVLAGTLAVSADANLGAADSAVTLGNGAALTATSGFTSSARLLTFSGTSATVETTAGTLTWQGATAGPGKLLKTGAGTLVLAGGIGHTGGADIAAGALEVSVSDTLGGTGITTWSGPISGSGAFVKSRAGTLELSGAATLTGGTFLRAGTLRTSAANILSATSAYFLIGGSTLDLAGFDQTVGDLDSYNHATQAVEASTVDLGGATLTNLTRVINLWAGDLTGTGTLVKKGTAEMKWYAANSFTGTLRVDAGTVSAQAAGVFSPHAVAELAAGTTLKLNNYDQSIAGLSGAGTVALGSAMLTSAQTIDTTFSGALAGTGAFVKSGTGTLALTGTNTFTGGLTLADGVLQLGSADALGSSGSIALTGGTLRFTTANTTDYSARFSSAAGQAYRFDTNGQDVTLASDLTSSGATLTKLGSGTLTLSGTNTYTGGTVLQQGVLAIERDAALGDGAGPVTFDGGTLRATGSFNASRATTLAAGGGTFDVLASQTLAWDGAISGSGALQKTGAGTLALGGANTYSGTTTVQAGTLRLASASALSPHTSLSIAPTARFEAGSYAPAFTNVSGGGTLDTGSAGVTFAPAASSTLGAALTGPGGFTKAGAATLTIAGTHDYTGATVVSAGRLVMNGAANGSAFTIDAGATLAGSGSIGSLTLASGSFISPGNSPGTLTVTRDATGAGGATYVWEINSASGTAGTHWDLLSISGTLNLAATAEQPFTIALTSLTPGNAAGAVIDFDAARDYDFVFATAAGGIAGFNASAFLFDTAAFANAAAGQWSVASDGTSLSVHYAASAIPEPATWTAFAALSALGFALLRRRRPA